MALFERLSVRRKLTALAMLTSGVALLLVGVALAILGSRSYRQSLTRQLRTQAEIIGINETSALVFGDERAASETLAALRAEPQIVLAVVYTADGQAFATYVRADVARDTPQAQTPVHPVEGLSFAHGALDLTRSIGPANRPIGKVFLRADLRDLRTQVFRSILIIAVVLILCLAAAMGIATALHKTIAEPILDLASIARTVASEKNYAARAQVRSRDEVGTLVETFNEMLSEIQKRDADLQKVNSQLVARTQELGRKNEEVEAFVYIVSHDLRGPLVNLQGFGRELQRSCQTLTERLHEATLPATAAVEVNQILDGDIPASLRFISASTNKFERLINALLQLSRSGRQEYRLETLNMDSLASATIDALRMNIDRSGASVTLQALPAARGDATAVGQVLSNLLVNATRYLEPQRPGRIEIGGTPNGTLNRYWVRDNGVGIPDSAKKKLFQVFQRFHPRLADGEGMGLATVKRIVERHGGSVWADSAEGSGTTFFFTLPTAGLGEGDRA